MDKTKAQITTRYVSAATDTNRFNATDNAIADGYMPTADGNIFAGAQQHRRISGWGRDSAKTCGCIPHH